MPKKDNKSTVSEHTSKAAGSSAAKTLSNPASSRQAKSAAGSDLSQRKNPSITWNELEQSLLAIKQDLELAYNARSSEIFTNVNVKSAIAQLDKLLKAAEPKD